MTAVNTLNITLYSYSNIDSHYCRLVLAHKNVDANIVEVKGHALPEDLLHLSPYHRVPVLIDREVVLYETRTIVEYIDERFPYPPLLTTNPATRAKIRLLCYRIFHDWFSLAEKILQAEDGDKAQYRAQLADGLTSVTAIFANQEFFLHEHYSLADCALSVLLWRLPLLGITLPPQAKPVLSYAQRMFKRESFQLSLSAQERPLQQQWNAI